MASLNPSGSPPETKVTAQTNYAAATGVVTWVLLTVFHVHLPAGMAAAVPVVVSTICGGIAGWMARHTPRLDEVARQVEDILYPPAPQQAQHAAPPPAPAQPPVPGPAPLLPQVHDM